MCVIFNLINYWFQNPILGCQSMSVYSGSDYTESNCYDKKQVVISCHIKSNAMKIILLLTTGHRPPIRVALGLDCWRMWEGDKELFSLENGLFVLRLGVLHRVKNNLLVTGSWAKRILWGASVSPDGAHTGGAFLCLLLNFKTSSKCLSRVAIGGRVTSLSLIKLNPGIKFDNFSLKQREAILHATRRKLSPNLVEFTPLWIKVDLD